MSNTLPPNWSAQQAMTANQRDWYRNLSNQNYGNQSGLGQHIEIERMSKEQIEYYLHMFTDEYDRRTLHTPLQGPTRQVLKDNPALDNAWNEMMTIWKLIGKK